MSTAETLPTYARPKRKIGDHPLIAISKEQFKDSSLSDDPNSLWFISRQEGGFEYFIGRPTTVLNVDVMEK